jgi:hypothetical protein
MEIPVHGPTAQAPKKPTRAAIAVWELRRSSSSRAMKRTTTVPFHWVKAMELMNVRHSSLDTPSSKTCLSLLRVGLRVRWECREEIPLEVGWKKTERVWIDSSWCSSGREASNMLERINPPKGERMPCLKSSFI